MALAVAIVACSSGPGSTGPAGPKGDKGDPGDTTTTPPGEQTPPPTVGSPPEVTMMFPDVYLTLAGAGDKNRSFTLREHFADIDSLLKYTVATKDAAIATAAVTDGVLKVTAIKDGNTTITVTAADDEGSMTAADDFPVTVVKTNAAPTTSGLNVTDVTELEKPLYIVEGLRFDTITVRSVAGAAAPVEDSIVDNFAVVIGAEKAKMPGVDADPADDMVTVAVKKGTGHNYDIEVTPMATAKDSQTVMIYPMDMFGAMVSEPWTFKAMFNTPPKELSKTFELIELVRGGTAAAVAPVDADLTDGGNVGIISISEYFVWESLNTSTMRNGTGDPEPPITLADPPTAAQLAMIDTVGDTVCGVSLSPTTLAVAQLLNEAGEDILDSASTDEAIKAHTVVGSQALFAIRIDSRYRSLGTDGIVSADNPLSAKVAENDTRATETGTVSITISCTDKDATATVTGRVVIRA